MRVSVHLVSEPVEGAQSISVEAWEGLPDGGTRLIWSMDYSTLVPNPFNEGQVLGHVRSILYNGYLRVAAELQESDQKRPLGI